VYSRDEADLFVRICSFFERAGYNIFDAQIHTTHHGYALDSFYVYIADNKGVPYRDLISYVEYELSREIREHAPLPTPRRHRVSRQQKHFPVEPHVLVRPDEKSGKYHVLSVLAGDRPGLLFTIAHVLARHRIAIHSAKIMTMGERAEDQFLVSGAELVDEKLELQLETDLLQHLRC
jgi:[protein-PII] uridylyltransferase